MATKRDEFADDREWERKIAAAEKEYRRLRNIVAVNACLSGATNDTVRALIRTAFEVAELYAEGIRP